MKRRILTKSTYIGFSVGIASLIIFTALPYYLETSIAFPGWGIYLSYADVHEKMMWLFPGMAFILALTTLKKKNTWEDIFLNVSAPIIVLLVLRNAQYHSWPVIAILSLSVTLALFKVIDIWYGDKYERVSLRKKARICYYYGRRRLGILLMVLLTPLTVWTVHNEYYNEGEYLRVFSSDTFALNRKETESDKWTAISEDEWDNLAANSRFEEFTKMVSYFLSDLGCSPLKVYACKELTDGTLAYYSDDDEAISVNIIYMDTCSYREAVHVAAHECRHCMQHQGIKAVEILEEAGVDCRNLEYFSDVYALKEAYDNYALDSMRFESYANNLMEQDSEKYALEQEEKMEGAGILRRG